MTTGDMWSPILSCLGTMWSSDASSVSTHFVKKWDEGEGKKGGKGETCLFCSNCRSSVQWAEEKNKTFVFFFFHLRKKMTNQQSLSWFGFARGCDRAVKDFMGRCPMIHWVIGFRPVLIADVPEPKNLGGFRRVLFSTIQQNGIWSASASRHSRRPSQFRGP